MAMRMLLRWAKLRLGQFGSLETRLENRLFGRLWSIQSAPLIIARPPVPIYQFSDGLRFASSDLQIKSTNRFNEKHKLTLTPQVLEAGRIEERRKNRIELLSAFCGIIDFLRDL